MQEHETSHGQGHTRAHAHARRRGIAPCFFVDSVERSIAWYHANLGFEVESRFEQPSSFAIVEFQGMRVLFREVSEQSIIQPNGRQPDAFDAYLWVSDISALHARVSETEADICSPLSLKEDYETLEFSVRDPDGYVIAFGQEVLRETRQLT